MLHALTTKGDRHSTLQAFGYAQSQPADFTEQSACWVCVAANTHIPSVYSVDAQARALHSLIQPACCHH